VLAVHFLILYLQLYLIICGFLNFKPERDVKFINGSLFFGLVVFDVIRHIHYGYQVVKWYDNILVILPMIVILYSLKGWRLWWVAVASFVFVSFVSMVFSYFFLPLFQLDIEYIMMNSLYSIIGGALGLFMLYLFYYATKKAKIELNIRGLTKGEITFVLFFLILFGFYVSNFYVIGINDYTFMGRLGNFLSLIGGIIGIYAVFYLITKDTKLKDVEKKEKEQQEMYKQLQQLFLKIEEQNLEIRRFKHDLDFELIKLNEYAENGNLKEILGHIKEMREDFAIRSEIEWLETGINELNASLLSLTTMPEYKDIKLKWKGGFPNKIKISSRDRSLLFNNLFKNAFEATSKCKDAKYIHIDVVAQENRMQIEIKNNFIGRVKQRSDGSFITTKGDKLNHGFGIITIKKIVEKYDGHIGFTHKNNEFKVKVVFTGSIYDFS